MPAWRLVRKRLERPPVGARRRRLGNQLRTRPYQLGGTVRIGLAYDAKSRTTGIACGLDFATPGKAGTLSTTLAETWRAPPVAGPRLICPAVDWETDGQPPSPPPRPDDNAVSTMRTGTLHFTFGRTAGDPLVTPRLSANWTRGLTTTATALGRCRVLVFNASVVAGPTRDYRRTARRRRGTTFARFASACGGDTRGKLTEGGEDYGFEVRERFRELAKVRQRPTSSYGITCSPGSGHGTDHRHSMWVPRRGGGWWCGGRPPHQATAGGAHTYCRRPDNISRFSTPPVRNTVGAARQAPVELVSGPARQHLGGASVAGAVASGRPSSHSRRRQRPENLDEAVGPHLCTCRSTPGGLPSRLTEIRSSISSCYPSG
jgi:hypothetical protein